MEEIKKMSLCTSLADLKKCYRKLAFENHPDRGGSEEKMKEINAEFERLHKKFESGYTYTKKDAEDYGNCSASQYTQYVYDEYRWVGSRYKPGLRTTEIFNLVREWLKKTYPTCKFSVRNEHYTSYTVALVSGDFEAYNENYEEIKKRRYYKDSELYTERCNEVMESVRAYVMSYNYDDSNPMIDYFNTNFYCSFNIGTHTKKFTNTTKLIGGEKIKKTPTEIKVGKALGSSNTVYFIERSLRTNNGSRESISEWLVCEKSDNYRYPRYYSQYSVLKRTIGKLREAGLDAVSSGSAIKICNWTDIRETIEREREEIKKEPQHESKTIHTHGEVKIVDYSENSIAVVGDTFPLRNELKKIGGGFNRHLKCGAGWIFSKKKESEVRSLIG